MECECFGKCIARCRCRIKNQQRCQINQNWPINSPASSFQNLLSLNFSLSDAKSINDSVLTSIGIYCQKLRLVKRLFVRPLSHCLYDIIPTCLSCRVLSLGCCHGVTDVGMRRLCVSHKDSGTFFYYGLQSLNVLVLSWIYLSHFHRS